MRGLSVVGILLMSQFLLPASAQDAFGTAQDKPTAAHRAEIHLHNCGEFDKACMAWTDGCRNCKRDGGLLKYRNRVPTEGGDLPATPTIGEKRAVARWSPCFDARLHRQKLFLNSVRIDRDETLRGGQHSSRMPICTGRAGHGAVRTRGAISGKSGRPVNSVG